MKWDSQGRDMPAVTNRTARAGMTRAGMPSPLSETSVQQLWLLVTNLEKIVILEITTRRPRRVPLTGTSYCAPLRIGGSNLVNSSQWRKRRQESNTLSLRGFSLWPIQCEILLPRQGVTETHHIVVCLCCSYIQSSLTDSSGHVVNAPLHTAHCRLLTHRRDC